MSKRMTSDDLFERLECDAERIDSAFDKCSSRVASSFDKNADRLQESFDKSKDRILYPENE